MITPPKLSRAAGPASAFDFSASPDPSSRMMENVAVMWIAPWRAYWALAAEAMDPHNYRH